MKKYAIIVAGGMGQRMNSRQPKQFLKLDGKPILVHTLEKFLLIESVRIILVLPRNHFDEWQTIQREFLPAFEIDIVVGGDTRTASVLAGLNAVNGDGLVAIHDGARPHVSVELIEECFKSAEKFGSGVAAVELKDSLRKKIDDGYSEARNRGNYVLVQTPQAFRFSELKEAYENIEGSYSDDATVFEKAGKRVRLVEGSYSNIKITTPEDLK